jgi:hypothetical protein
MDTRGIVIEDGAILHSKVATPRAVAVQDATSKITIAEATSADSLPEKVMAEKTETSPRAKGAAAASGDS